MKAKLVKESINDNINSLPKDPNKNIIFYENGVRFAPFKKNLAFLKETRKGVTIYIEAKNGKFEAGYDGPVESSFDEFEVFDTLEEATEFLESASVKQKISKFNLRRNVDGVYNNPNNYSFPNE